MEVGREEGCRFYSLQVERVGQGWRGEAAEENSGLGYELELLPGRGGVLGVLDQLEFIQGLLGKLERRELL